MAQTEMAGARPSTQALHRPLHAATNPASVDDLLLLEVSEAERSMHLDTMLRIRQNRRANPQLSTEIAAKLTIRRMAIRPELLSPIR
jgi:hypothetical protein